MAPLSPDLILALTAGDHVADQGPSGFIGHYGSDGWDFATRVTRRGGDPYGGENISYGYDTAREVIIQLLVDDNIADRGHRVNLFRDGYVRAGVSCGPHAVFNHMCVIDYGYEPVKRR
ncbi:CAP domain-containing protein [Brevundimonas goettingensis]|uniref:CAP domain-containing protein n=2 Tax=Brevundimonas goettingensis TaxID=2774190 RepID=A0A975BZD4_9CAUL|nr:CAP domain-containing protein [Brevundimonas goettingensis]